MSVFSSLLTSPPADAVLEIGADEVTAVALTARGSDAVVQASAVEPLPPGAVVPSLTSPNVVQAAAVRDAVQAALGRLGPRPRRVALLIPDVAGRVSIVHFDRPPARQEDLDQLVRWQLKKAAPFPIDDALLTFAPAGRDESGADFLAIVARRDVVRSYETVCEQLDLHPGLVELASFGLVHLALTAGPTAGDRLLIHVRPAYTSVAILRGDAVIFFRTVPADDAEGLADIVHQTSMYHEDRLSGGRFSAVLLGGFGQQPESIADARRQLESRVGAPVQLAESLRPAVFADRIGATPDLLARLAPLVGTWMRMRAEVVGA